MLDDLLVVRSNDLLSVSEWLDCEADKISKEGKSDIQSIDVALSIEGSVTQIDEIEEEIKGYELKLLETYQNLNESKKFLAECRLRLGEELKKQKDEDGVTATILADGRTVTSRALPAKLVIVDESKIPQQYITYEKVMVEKKVIDKAAIMRDGNVEGTMVEPVKYIIQIKEVKNAEER